MVWKMGSLLLCTECGYVSITRLAVDTVGEEREEKELSYVHVSH